MTSSTLNAVCALAQRMFTAVFGASSVIILRYQGGSRVRELGQVGETRTGGKQWQGSLNYPQTTSPQRPSLRRLLLPHPTALPPSTASVGARLLADPCHRASPLPFTAPQKQAKEKEPTCLVHPVGVALEEGRQKPPTASQQPASEVPLQVTTLRSPVLGGRSQESSGARRLDSCTIISEEVLPGQGQHHLQA